MPLTTFFVRPGLPPVEIDCGTGSVVVNHGPDEVFYDESKTVSSSDGSIDPDGSVTLTGQQWLAVAADSDEARVTVLPLAEKAAIESVSPLGGSSADLSDYVGDVHITGDVEIVGADLEIEDPLDPTNHYTYIHPGQLFLADLVGGTSYLQVSGIDSAYGQVEPGVLSTADGLGGTVNLSSAGLNINGGDVGWIELLSGTRIRVGFGGDSTLFDYLSGTLTITDVGDDDAVLTPALLSLGAGAGAALADDSLTLGANGGSIALKEADGTPRILTVEAGVLVVT